MDIAKNKKKYGKLMNSSREFLLIRAIVLLGVALCCFGWSPAYGAAMKLEIGSDAPDFSLKEFRSGEEKALKDFLGKKIVMIEFWATWCNICTGEMPQLQKQYEQYGKNGYELLAVTLSRGDQSDKRKIAELIEKYKLTFPVLMDTEFEVATQQYGLSGPIPLKVIIDCKGKIRYSHVGGFADGISEVPFVLDQLLAENECGGEASTAVADKSSNPEPVVKGYVGSDRCGECHAEKLRTWKETLHAEVVKNAKEDPSVVLGDFSVSGLGFTIDDIEYAIGGHWDQRYLKKIGEEYFVLPKLWSVSSKKWRDYNVWSWRKKPYRKFCKGCHVTAYLPEENKQSELRVGCEACHGPGASHVESEDKIGNIVNPAKLEKEKRNMICAACHVRGMDVSAEYFFPVGFKPGEDLGKYYSPLDKAEGETNTQAILRGFEAWTKKKSSNMPLQCNVCGIKPPSGHESGNGKGIDFCFGCHDFKDSYSEHTRHPTSVVIECDQCHVQANKQLMNPGNMDIHTYGYFLVHTDSCYDPLIENKCKECHKDKDKAWARKNVEIWRGKGQLDH